MLEILQYGFMVRALMAGAVIGTIAPIIGTFLVSKRYSLMADSLAHISLAGVAVGLMISVYPVLTALIAAVIAAIVIELLRTEKRVSGELSLAMFLSGGLAIAVVLIGLAGGFNADLFSYLFGSITTVQQTDVWVITALGTVVLAVMYVFYEELLYVSFDEEAARVSGVPVRLTNVILVVLTAVIVSVSMRIVGVLLIGALMVIPVVTAMQVARSFRQTITMASVFGLGSTLLGLVLSYYLDLAAGGTIVVLSLVVFSFTMLISRK